MKLLEDEERLIINLSNTQLYNSISRLAMEIRVHPGH